jgi:hypothetical protein
MSGTFYNGTVLYSKKIIGIPRKENGNKASQVHRLDWIWIRLGSFFMWIVCFLAPKDKD